MEEKLPFRSVLDTDDLAKLTRILETHCEKFGIRNEDARTHVATSLMNFYRRGFVDETVLAELIAEQDNPDRRPKT